MLKAESLVLLGDDGLTLPIMSVGGVGVVSVVGNVAPDLLKGIIKAYDRRDTHSALLAHQTLAPIAKAMFLEDESVTREICAARHGQDCQRVQVADGASEKRDGRQVFARQSRPIWRIRMSREPIDIALFGAAGRMGKVLLHEARLFPSLKMTHVFDPAGAGQYFDDLMIEPKCYGVHNHVKVAVDFSTANSVIENVHCCRQSKVNYVCGVTGVPENVKKELREAAKDIAVLHAPNMSPGMNVLFALVAEAAAALPGYEIYLSEAHHTGRRSMLRRERRFGSPRLSKTRLARSLRCFRFALEMLWASIRSCSVDMESDWRLLIVPIRARCLRMER